MFLDAQLVAGRRDVDLLRQQRNLVLLLSARPRDGLLTQRSLCVFGNIDHVRELLVDSVAFLEQFHVVLVVDDDVGEGSSIEAARVDLEFVAQV